MSGPRLLSPHRLSGSGLTSLFTCLLSLLVLGGSVARAGEKLPVLRRTLLEAQTEEDVNRALFTLAERIGQAGFFADHGAFANWLIDLPDGKDAHRLVRQRIGWALIRAKRGGEAVTPLEAALEEDPSDGLTRAYLGEALRQAGRFGDAAEMLAMAARCGERGPFVYDGIVACLVQLQQEKPSEAAEGLPAYVQAAEAYLQVNPDARIHHMLADMLLSDFKAFGKPERKRGQLWASAAGRHLLAALAGSPGRLAKGDQMAYDAALALEVLDRKTDGGTLRFDLLAEAYKLGINPADGTHARPKVLVLLAESAAAEGRFALAYRLAQERLGIANSPRARRLLMRLPPDLESD